MTGLYRTENSARAARAHVGRLIHHIRRRAEYTNLSARFHKRTDGALKSQKRFIIFGLLLGRPEVAYFARKRVVEIQTQQNYLTGQLFTRFTPDIPRTSPEFLPRGI